MWNVTLNTNGNLGFRFGAWMYTWRGVGRSIYYMRCSNIFRELLVNYDARCAAKMFVLILCDKSV